MQLSRNNFSYAQWQNDDMDNLDGVLNDKFIKYSNYPSPSWAVLANSSPFPAIL